LALLNADIRLIAHNINTFPPPFSTNGWRESGKIRKSFFSERRHSNELIKLHTSEGELSFHAFDVLALELANAGPSFMDAGGEIHFRADE
jgi:hypothetical protein